MSELTKPEALLPCSAGELPRETSGILRILGRNTLWLWIDLGALRLGTMLAGLFLIRYFGPKSFGIYSMALAVGWIANSVIDLGLTRYSARAVAATREEVRPILALSLFTTIAAVIPTIAVLAIASRINQLQVACLAAGFVLCNLEGTSSLCSSGSAARAATTLARSRSMWRISPCRSIWSRRLIASRSQFSGKFGR